MTTPEVRQHGVRGVYLGGHWKPIEEIEEVRGAEQCNKDCGACPRSRSRKSAAKADGSYDVVVIGAGCIGAAIARELSKFTASVLLIEAADDVTQGATKGNSGIVHAGFDDKPGSIRAKFCWPGNQMFPQLDKELHFGYQQNGSLVLANGKEEEKVLQELLERGKTNGVERLQILTRKQVVAMEPYVNPKVTAALYSPDAGNLIPYEYAIALAENAVDNGVELRIRREVTAITPDADHSGYTITARYWEPQSYVDNLKKEGLSVPTLLLSLSGPGIVLGAMLVQYLPQLNLGAFPQLAEAVDAALLAPHLVYIAALALVYAVGFLVNLLAGGGRSGGSGGGGGGVGKSAASVGSGGRDVTVDEMKQGGSGCASVMQGVTMDMESIRARYVVNAAGCYSDKIAKMVGDDHFYIKPRLGNYVLLNRNQGHLASHTLFPCPHPVLGKGVLVQTTLWGNLILGPTARDMHLPEVAAETTDEILTFILGKCRELVPAFDVSEVIHTFAGARAKNSTGDWVIGQCATSKQFINAAGIDSPGLAGSPAIALEVVRLLQEAGLTLTKDVSFNPIRAPIITPKDGWKGIRAGAVGKVTDPKQNVVCKCEKVTEAEVVEALHRGLPIDSTQGIRKRTRAGMGHCQGDAENYNCECRVADIIARENSLSAGAVGRRPWPATSSLPSRWPSSQQKADIAALVDSK